MNSVLIIATLLCFVTSAASFSRYKTLPSNKKLGSHGFYVDREAFRWYGTLALFLGIAALVAAFLI